MNDTTPEMTNKQREIFFAKPHYERFLIGVESISFGRFLVENSIKNETPRISDVELKILIFKRYYQNIFSKEEIDIIIDSMRNYFEKKKDN